MERGALITFSLANGTEHRRSPGFGAHLSRRQKELEEAYVRSNIAKLLHAKRKHTRKAGSLPAGGSKRYAKQQSSSPRDLCTQEKLLSLLMSPTPVYLPGDESNALQFYLSNTVLPGGSHASQDGFAFWRVMAPQVSWQYDSIKHAIIALSYVIRAYVYGSTDNGGAIEVYLKRQNMAIARLAGTSTPKSVMIIAAMLFSVTSSMQGEWDDAHHHCKAALKILDSTSEDQPRELAPVLKYIRSLSENLVEYWIAMKNSRLPLLVERLVARGLTDPDSSVARASSLNPADRRHFTAISPDTTDLKPSKGNQQRIFFNSLLELTIAQSRLQLIMEVLKSGDIQMSFTDLYREGGKMLVLMYVRKMLRRVDQIYGRWTSEPYLARYQSLYLSRCLASFHRLFNEAGVHTCQPAGLRRLEQMSSSPFVRTICELAYLVGAETPQSKTDMGAAQCSTKVSFQEFTYRIEHDLYVFLLMTAGNNTQLRKDVEEQANTMPAEDGQDGNRLELTPGVSAQAPLMTSVGRTWESYQSCTGHNKLRPSSG